MSRPGPCRRAEPAEKNAAAGRGGDAPGPIWGGGGPWCPDAQERGRPAATIPGHGAASPAGPPAAA
jgi:hypothetical protein